MNTLIIDNATLSATKLKCLLKSRNLNATIIVPEKLSVAFEKIDKDKGRAIRYIFISIYAKCDLVNLVNKLVSNFPQAHIILVYVKGHVMELPSSSYVIRDGVLGHPFDKKELDRLLLFIETR